MRLQMKKYRLCSTEVCFKAIVESTGSWWWELSEGLVACRHRISPLRTSNVMRCRAIIQPVQVSASIESAVFHYGTLDEIHGCALQQFLTGCDDVPYRLHSCTKQQYLTSRLFKYMSVLCGFLTDFAWDLCFTELSLNLPFLNCCRLCHVILFKFASFSVLRTRYIVVYWKINRSIICASFMHK